MTGHYSFPCVTNYTDAQGSYQYVAQGLPPTDDMLSGGPAPHHDDVTQNLH